MKTIEARSVLSPVTINGIRQSARNTDSQPYGEHNWGLWPERVHTWGRAKHIRTAVDSTDPWQIALPYQIISYFKGLFGSNASPMQAITPAVPALNISPAKIDKVLNLNQSVRPNRPPNVKYVYSINKSPDTISVASGDGSFNGERYAPGDTMSYGKIIDNNYYLIKKY